MQKLSLKHLVIISLLALGMTAQYCGFGGSGPKGVWATDNNGQDWQKINLVSDKDQKLVSILDNMDVRQIVVSSDRDDVLYLATPAGVFATDNHGQLWFHVLKNVNVYAVEVSSSNPEIVYAVGKEAGEGVVYKSLNRGKDWIKKYVEVSGEIVWSLAINPHDSEDVLVGLESGILLSSRNGGESWRLSQSFNSRIQQIRHNPYDPRIHYLLLRGQGLMMSRDGGNSYLSLTDSFRTRLPSRNSIVQPRVFINFDFTDNNPSKIYLTTDKGLFRSLNGGLNWVEMRLPVDPSRAVTVALKAVNDQKILVSIDTVLYKSTDNGKTYKTFKIPTNRLIRTITTIPSLPEVIYLGMIDS